MKPTTTKGGLLRLALAAGMAAGTFAWTGCEKDYHYIAPPPTQPISLSNDLQPIFNTRCTSCHDGSLDPDLRDGFSHNSLWVTGDIDTANAVNSVLYVRVTRPSSASGAMPPGGPSLSSQETAMILNWIEEGAHNN